MKSTMLSLLKFECDNPKCLHECWVNRNNNMLTHYNADMSALLDWICPECREGRLRYASANARFEYELRKHKKEDASESGAVGGGASAGGSPAGGPATQSEG